MLLTRVTGSEHEKQGNEKWERNREMENEVTDRARVQVRFCFLRFSFPVPRGARFPLFPFLVLVTSYQKLKFSNCTSMNYSHI